MIDAGWCAGKAECIQCGYEWIAVWPLDADDLECPSCSSSSDTMRWAAPPDDSPPADPGRAS